MHRMMILLAVAMSLAVLLLAHGVSSAWGRRVDAGGPHVRMLIRGTAHPGEPSVILESGLGAPLEGWAKVQPEISRFTRVVSYDRANTSGSPVDLGPRDAVHIADELHTALKNAGVAPPYILVGHSLGGPFARVFAHRFPSEVAGLVLIEPSEVQNIQLEKVHIGDDDRASNSELVWLAGTLSQTKASDPLPQVPVTVITGARDIDNPNSPAYRPELLEARAQWVRSIPRGTHILARNSYHLPQQTEPALVVQAIKDVFESARR